MKEQTIKKCTIASIIVAGLGLVCFLVKLIENTKWCLAEICINYGYENDNDNNNLIQTYWCWKL